MEYLPAILDGTILAGIIALVTKSYLPSYFKKKGENLATKEDIAGITRLVEEVKSDFIKEHEELKTSLGIASQRQIVFAEEQRQALLKFYDRTSELFHEEREYDVLQDVRPIHLKRAIQYEEFMKRRCTLLARAYFRLMLYVTNEEDIIHTATVILDASVPIIKHYIDKYQRVREAAINLQSCLKDEAESSQGAKADYDSEVSAFNKDAYPLMKVLGEAMGPFSKALTKFLHEGAAIPKKVVLTTPQNI